MRYKALLIDFFGTLAQDDNQAVASASQQVRDASPLLPSYEEIGAYWWESLLKLMHDSHGDAFRTQRQLEYQSMAQTLSRFQCKGLDVTICEALFAFWSRPALYDDTLPFLAENPLPVCIVSNIDRDDIIAALSHNGIHYDALVASEDARCYKPNEGIFRMALDKMGLAAHQVLHVGDSYRADVVGARQCGIDAFWLNRAGRPNPLNSLATYSGCTLLDILPLLDGKQA